jgi:hypothetical protein
VLNESGQSLKYLKIELQRDPSAGCFGPFTGTALQALFDLGAALLEEPSSLGELGFAS